MIFPLKPAFIGGFPMIFPLKLPFIEGFPHDFLMTFPAATMATSQRLRSLAESQERNEFLLNGLKAELWSCGAVDETAENNDRDEQTLIKHI